MNKKQILPVEPSDLESIIDLLNHYNLITEDIDLNKQIIIKITQNNKISGIGGIELYEPFGLIRSLAISPDKTKLGFATEIIAKLEQIAKSKKINDLYLLTETTEVFFTNVGYKSINRDMTPEAIKQTNQFSALCPASAVIMVKSIIPLT